MTTLAKGLKFRSHAFAAQAEVVEVREADNMVHIRYTTTEGHAHVQCENLKHVQNCFNSGVHYVEKVENNKFGFI